MSEELMQAFEALFKDVISEEHRFEHRSRKLFTELRKLFEDEARVEETV